jgi:hypothetical protein
MWKKEEPLDPAVIQTSFHPAFLKTVTTLTATSRIVNDLYEEMHKINTLRRGRIHLPATSLFLLHSYSADLN